jgi:hypothetical protein
MFYDLKKLVAASFEARFFTMTWSSRSISVLSNALRSPSSSTDYSDKS